MAANIVDDPSGQGLFTCYTSGYRTLEKGPLLTLIITAPLRDETDRERVSKLVCEIEAVVLASKQVPE